MPMVTYKVFRNEKKIADGGTYCRDCGCGETVEDALHNLPIKLGEYVNRLRHIPNPLTLTLVLEIECEG